jgi:hypothetical protein
MDSRRNKIHNFCIQRCSKKNDAWEMAIGECVFINIKIWVKSVRKNILKHFSSSKL